MEFKLITEIFKNIDLENPSLEAISVDDDYYSTLIYQPIGELEYNVDFIRIKDVNLAKAKFENFFKVAIEKKVSLAITPEYSCPWSVVESVINAKKFPAVGKLWIIGCESIKAKDLKKLIDSKPEVKWIVEKEKIEEFKDTNKFFDPVCYIFKTNSSKGLGQQTVIIVQFKTHPLGGKYMLWEKDNFISGDTVYVLENVNSQRLMTWICSDTFNPKLDFKKIPNYGHIPYLIVHIQLNEAPTNTNYSKYRVNAYDMGWNSFEFLCVNWARKVILDNKEWNKFGGSALYMQTDQINIDDDRINSNHKKGLHYTNWITKKNAKVFFFNYDEYLFLFKSSKISQIDAAPEVRRRTGPEMLETYKWNNGVWESIQRTNDGFIDLCKGLNKVGKFEALVLYHPDKPLDVERLVYLSIGEAVIDDWHTPLNLKFFDIIDDEINKKITFLDNPCDKTQKEREQRLHMYGTLECKIITDPKKIPDNIKDLRKNCSIQYRINSQEKQFNINLYPLNSDSSAPATGAYLGMASREVAESVLNKMLRQIPEGNFKNRTVVWYLQNDDILNVYDPDPPKITSVTKKSKNSIKNRR